MISKYIQTKYKGYDIAKQIKTSASGEIEIKIYPSFKKIITKIEDAPDIVFCNNKDLKVNAHLKKYILNVIHPGSYHSDIMRTVASVIAHLYYYDNITLTISNNEYNLYVDLFKIVIKHIAEQLKLYKYSKITNFSINIENKFKKEITKEIIKGVGQYE